jgi:putative nucleotidyltransferase with HDIG domain
MKDSIPKFLESRMAKFTDHLTMIRKQEYIWKLQIILVLLTLIVQTGFISFPYFGQEKIDLSPDGEYALGSVSPENIISQIEIVYDDPQKTQIERTKAYNSGSYIFERDYIYLTNSVYTVINEEINNLKVYGSNNIKNIPTLLSKNLRWKNKSKEDLEFLVQFPDKDKLKELIQQCTNLLFSSSCILKENPELLGSMKIYGGKVNNRGIKEKYSILDGKFIIPRDYLYSNKETINIVQQLINEKFPKIEVDTMAVIKRMSLSYLYSYPSCSYNAEDTEEEKLELQDKVKPVKSKIQKNEKLISKGELITPETFLKLEQLNLQASRTNLKSIFSVLIVQLVVVSIMLTFLKKYDPKKLNDLGSNLIIFSLIWILIIISFITSRLYYHPDNNYDSTFYYGLFVPIGLICLLISFIFDEQLAIATGFFLSFYIFQISYNNLYTFIIVFSIAIFSSIQGSKIRKRIDFIKSGILISGIEIILSTSGYLLDNRDFWVTSSSDSILREFLSANIIKVYLACIINGFACVTIAQFLLPIYEYLFNIPTRFKLQELADTGHPLLQALLTLAPSTYTHTFMVAAMSERAAQKLNLNWILIRAGVYFHDIGKIPNAGFFVENQHLIPKAENIDKNNPGKAAKIVIDHVIDGIEMAKKARLPREVINFIPEHHGTSTMAFFYHKALSNLSPKQRSKINKKDFQYPGPKPQSKETAIVMIADSVEAASRSLDQITIEALNELIQKIINIKLNENQLDESGITLGDLKIIKDAFIEILISSLHHRPKYPNSEATSKLEKESQDIISKKKIPNSKK